MTRASAGQLNAVAKFIIQLYFGWLYLHLIKFLYTYELNQEIICFIKIKYWVYYKFFELFEILK